METAEDPNILVRQLHGVFSAIGVDGRNDWSDLATDLAILREGCISVSRDINMLRSDSLTRREQLRIIVGLRIEMKDLANHLSSADPPLKVAEKLLDKNH